MDKNAWMRNIPAITEKEQERLQAARVFIAGCGGIGGYCLEFLARLGVGSLTAADGDCFEPSNLNRQLLATADTLGKNKAEAAAERVRKICPETEIRALPMMLGRENAEELLGNAELAIDALDNAESRLILAGACRKMGIPLIHGAVQGWRAQIAVCLPCSRILEQLYGDAAPAEDKSCLSFTPALCAALECAEAVKLLCGRETQAESRLITVDLECMETAEIPLK